MSSMDKVAKELYSAITKKDERTPKPYDTEATVVREEGDTIWVKIPGGIDETPVRKTINAKPGDNVQVRVADGRAWVMGNSTNPPTDDSTANYAVNIANGVQKDVVVLNTVVADNIQATNAKFEYVEADTAKIHNLEADEIHAGITYTNELIAEDVTTEKLTAASGYIEDLTADEITTNDIKAATGYISDLTADHITAGDIVADHADIDDLKSNKADINLANVNVAWIEQGNIKKAEVFDENVFDLSGNRATIARIDASKINVANLRADNLVVRRINGQPVVGGYTLIDSNSSGYSSKNPQALGWYEFVNADWVLSTDTTVDMTKAYYQEGNEVSLYDQAYIDGLESDLQQQIDGAVETFTGSVVPTLTNWPYTDWYDTSVTPIHDERAKHVGDIYYVVNSSSPQGGYCYRFAYDNTTHAYSWVLIKDSDVTKALSDISELQTFESETTSWIDETDQGLETIRTNYTNLSGRVDDVEDTANAALPASTFETFESTTFTDLVDEVDEQSTTMTNMTTRLGLNADGTQSATDIVSKETALEQTVDGISTRVGKTEAHLIGMYATSSTAAGTAAKVATIIPAIPSGTTWELSTGTTITVKFTNANTTASPTLNVNSKGAKPIKTYANGNLTEAEYKWKAGSTFTFTYNGTNWLMQDSTASVRLTSNETSITQTADSIISLASGNTTYTKPDGTTATSAIGTTVSQTANNVLIKATRSGATDADKSAGGTSAVGLINVTPDNVKIKAKHVEIDGTAIFNAISDDVDGAIGDAVDDIEIGGKNIVPKSQNLKSFTVESSAVTATYTSTSCTVVNNASNAYAYGIYYDLSVESNANYILSATFSNVSGKVKWSIGDQTTGTSRDPWQGVNYYSNVNNGYNTKQFKTPEDCNEIRIYLTTVNNGSKFTISKLKLEKGTKATDWTPALADVRSTHTVTAQDDHASYPYANILMYSEESDSRWNIGDNTGINVGDTVRIKVIASDMGDNGTPVYIIGTVTYVNPNGYYIKIDAHGLDTTVIDGGHILTGTIDANKVNVSNLTVGTFKEADKNSILNSKIEIGGRNLARGTADMADGLGLWSEGTWRYSEHSTVTYSYTVNDSPVAGVNKGVLLTSPSESGRAGIAQDHCPMLSKKLTYSVWVKGTSGGELLLQSVWWDGVPGDSNWWKVVTTTGSWQYISFTTDLTNATVPDGNCSICYAYFKGVNTGDTCIVLAPKLEYGTKATDWTPAPEDTKSIHTLLSSNTDGATYANLLNWCKDGTTGGWGVQSTTGVRVGDTIRIGYPILDMGTAGNRPIAYCIGTVTSVNSATNISMISHGLDTTVIDGGNILTNSIGANQIKANEIGTDLLTVQARNDVLNSNIQIGGRNLIPLSQNLKSFTVESTNLGPATFTNVDCYVSVVTTNTSRYGIYYDVGVSANTQYTLSFKTSGVTGDVRYAIGNRTGDNAGWNDVMNYVAVTNGANSSTFTVPSGVTKIRIYIGGLKDSHWYIWKIKLEVGNKATDWTPALNDTPNVHNVTASGVDASYPYANILNYSEATNSTWNIGDNSGLVVGDTVRIKVIASDMGANGTPVYITGTVSEIPSNNTHIRIDAHGLDTTVIDGGHILTGTIDANKVNISSLTVGTAKSGWNGLMNSEVQVGGKNLCKNTGFNDLSMWSGSPSVSDGKLTITTATEVNLLADYRTNYTIPIGTQYTVSCYFYENTIADGNRRIYFQSMPNWDYWTVPANFTGLFSRTGTAWQEITQLAIDYDTRGATSGKWVVGPVKIELGNKATDWTPAPEDISEVKYVDSTYSVPYNTLLNWVKLATDTYTVTSTVGLKVGDVVYIRVTCSTTNSDMYVQGQITAIISTTKITIRLLGLVDKPGYGSTIATSYITEVNSAGITIHPSGGTNDRIELNGSGMRIYKGNSLRATFSDEVHLQTANGTYPKVGINATSAWLGTSSDTYADMRTDGLNIVKGGTSVAFYGDEARVGKPDKSRVYITPDNGMRVYDKNNKRRLWLDWDGFYLYDDSEANVSAFTPTSIRIGRSDKGHTTVNDNGLYIFDVNNKKRSQVDSSGLSVFDTDGSTNVATFGASARVGKTTDTNITITAASTDSGVKMNVKNSAGTSYVRIADIGFDNSQGYETDHNFPKGSWYTLGYRAGTAAQRGYYSLVAGFNCIASHNASVSTGINNKVYAPCGFAVGMENEVGDSSKTSQNSYTSNGIGNCSATIGYGLKTGNGVNQLVCGEYNQVDTNARFIVGGGGSTSTRYNLFSVGSDRIYHGTHTVPSTTSTSTSTGFYLGLKANRWLQLYSWSAVNTGSDGKRKDVLGDIDFAKELIMGLEPVEFQWKDSDHIRSHMGFIAQDAAKVGKALGKDLSFYEASYIDESKGDYHGEEVSDEELSWGMMYDELIAPLVKVVQMQQKEIDQLKIKLKHIEDVR